ncbi:MAG TPA: hypothetical protein IAC18_00595 [Candidatus Scatomorpha merdipullorum]|uniref:Uncharacterized protein n=1 Tax=Candidatus Scatomorpha merdipullorum TaxID=2840927 RepID=A0A9D1FBT2_9FIRM|nr:hypothetical protein [Candidatus Scatomorpha merdipullorum]
MEVIVCLFGAFALPTLCFASFHVERHGAGAALGALGFVMNLGLSVWYLEAVTKWVRIEGMEAFAGFGVPGIVLAIAFAGLFSAAITVNAIKLRAAGRQRHERAGSEAARAAARGS